MPKILVVDDLEENVYALSRTLKFFGYDVLSAGNGIEAIEKATDEHPDVIILDIQMPVMDGYEACKRLKSADETKHIPVIFLTARFPELGDKVKGLEVGADGYLTKPFHDAELISEVRALVRIKELYDELSYSQCKLKEYTEQLEEMVEERTAELKATQAKLVQTERLSAIGKLAAEIAHEVNNPLSIIKNYLRLISDDIAEDDPHSESLSIVGGEVERIAKIVRELLKFSKPRLNLERADLNEVAGKIVVFYRDALAKKGVVIREELNAANPIVMVDLDGIKQVMINIVNNSLDSMPDGGVLTVSTCSGGGYFKLSFRDTGSGIPDHVMGRIFEPFFTTKGGSGTGLGLSICYAIVKGLKGDIEVESKAGEGTHFKVSLPLEERCK